MKLKIVTFIAAALLLSGCASDKEPSTSDSSSFGQRHDSGSRLGRGFSG